MSVAGGVGEARERIERLIAAGELPRAAVTRAEQFWQERFRYGILLPNGETAHVTLGDLYHVIIDDRIWRHPERIERILQGIIEIRTARQERRRALSRWQEDGLQLFGYAILEPDGRVRTLHVVVPSEFRRQQRQGERRWPQ